MAPLRELFGRAVRSDGTPVRFGRVYITATAGTYLSDEAATQVQATAIPVPTDAEGDFAKALQVNESGVDSSAYELRYDRADSDVVATFVIDLSGDALDEDGNDPTPLSLSDARLLYADASDPNYAALTAHVDDLIEDEVDDAVQAAIADLGLFDVALEIPFVYAGAEARRLFRSSWRLLASAGLSPAHRAAHQTAAAATATTFTLYHVTTGGTETSVGTVVYGVGTAGVVTVAANQDFTAGQQLIWRQTGDVDGTLQYVSVTLGGTAI